MGNKEPQSRRGSRDSENGQFVKKEYAEKHPKTTQNENIPLPGYGDTGRGKKDK